MKRTLPLAAFMLVAGCKLTDDPHLKEHLALAHQQMARLRASTEAFVRKSGHCPKATEVERVVDPWGSAYVIVCPGQSGHAADVASKGADGDIGTTDDVRTWD